MSLSTTSRLAITAARRTSSRAFFAQSRHYAADTTASTASTGAVVLTRSLQDLEGSYESMSVRLRELSNELVPQHAPPKGPAWGLPQHQPDYDAAVDYRTSTFSPVPKRLMDGSEPGETVAAAVLSGAPSDLQARTVRIYRPAKPATQSGDWHGHHWTMDWDPLAKGNRWENPLMGWQSSADFMQGERISFKSKEDAIAFANKQGYEYFVQEPNERRVVPKAYANNFVHIPNKLKVIRTK